VEAKARSLGNLHFLGSSYRGVSVSDCVKQAQDFTAKLSDDLQKITILS